MSKHQVGFLSKINNQKGLAFIILHYRMANMYVLVPIEVILFFNSPGAKRKSLPYGSVEKDFIIKTNNGYLDYIGTLNTYLRFKEKRANTWGDFKVSFS